MMEMTLLKLCCFECADCPPAKVLLLASCCNPHLDFRPIHSTPQDSLTPCSDYSQWPHRAYYLAHTPPWSPANLCRALLAASAPSSRPKSPLPLPSLAHLQPSEWRPFSTSTARCVYYNHTCLPPLPFRADFCPWCSLHPIFVQLPKGPASSPNTKSLNPLARYKARYFDGKNASGAPIVHAIVGIFLIGYTVGACPPPSDIA